MRTKGIKLILIHIDEAHSNDAWPVGLQNTTQSHACIEDRISRANKFIEEEIPPFLTYVDSWSNSYAELFRAWPDKYYCINPDNNIEYMSTYGTHDDNNAVIQKDCTVLIEELM